METRVLHTVQELFAHAVEDAREPEVQLPIFFYTLANYGRAYLENEYGQFFRVIHIFNDLYEVQDY